MCDKSVKPPEPTLCDREIIQEIIIISTVERSLFGMKKIMAIFITMAMASALTACGGSEPSAASVNPTHDSAEASEELVIHASNYKFDKDEYHLAKGTTVKITMKSQGMHGIAIDGLGVNLKKNNASQTITLDEAGTYDIVCNIVCGAGHKTMVSKLIVE